MDREIHGECSVWSIAETWKKSKGLDDFMLIIGLNETISQLTMTV